jgi:hypothetical protein|tara:strand:- start:3407 stop:4186 length:780 start_codon:yes stop_codon:yes gene_type:complete
MNTMKLEDTLFPVSEVPAVWEDVAPMAPQANVNTSNHKFIINDKTQQVISCMTNDYKLVTNEEVINSAHPILKEYGATLREVQVFGNGARTHWKWKFPDTVTIGEDKLQPEAIIKNSYDGSCQISVLAGVFRLVCMNGLVIGTVYGKFSNRHIVHNQRLDKLDETIPHLITHVKEMIGVDVPFLQKTKIKETDIVKLIELFPEPIEGLLDYFKSHKMDTYWDLLNAATWFLTHSMNRSRESVHKLESKVYPTISSWAAA